MFARRMKPLSIVSMILGLGLLVYGVDLVMSAFTDKVFDSSTKGTITQCEGSDKNNLFTITYEFLVNGTKISGVDRISRFNSSCDVSADIEIEFNSANPSVNRIALHLSNKISGFILIGIGLMLIGLALLL